MPPPPQIFVNPHRGRGAGAAGGDPSPADTGATAPRAFHRRLPGYAPTPLVELPDLAARFGLERLWVKDESSRLGLPSFKILGASWATYRVLVERLGHEPSWSSLDDLRAALAPLGDLTLVAATDGNHGRAVAHMANLLGYNATILVPAGTAEARISGIASEGAAVAVVDGTYDDAVRKAAELASDTALVVSDTSWPGYTDVPQWVIEGYATIFDEVTEQLAAEGPIDLVVVQMGVGALTAAVVARFAEQAVVVAVEPLSAACGLASAMAGEPVEVPGPHPSIMAGLNCGTVSLIAWPAVSAGVDVFVAVSDAAAEWALRELAKAGLVSGETGAAGLAGLAALVDEGSLVADNPLFAGRRALLISTEGATDPQGYSRILGSTSE